MAKNNLIFVIIGILIVLALGGLIQKQYGIFAVGETSTMTRSVPTSVSPSSTFQISYSVSGVTGKWGASITDSVNGGCTIDGKTSLNFVMLSDLPNPLVYTVTAPSSGSCTFHNGDYKFGTESIVPFPDQTITISTGGNQNQTCTSSQTKCEGTTYFTCSNNNWVSQGLVDGKCGYIGPAKSCSSNSDCQSLTCGNWVATCSSGYCECKQSEIPSFDINMVLFSIGGFQVTLLMVLIVGGLLVLILILK